MAIGRDEELIKGHKYIIKLEGTLPSYQFYRLHGYIYWQDCVILKEGSAVPWSTGSGPKGASGGFGYQHDKLLFTIAENKWAFIGDAGDRLDPRKELTIMFTYDHMESEHEADNVLLFRFITEVKTVCLKDNTGNVLYPKVHSNSIDNLVAYIKDHIPVATPTQIGEFLRNYDQSSISVTRIDENEVLISFKPFPKEIVDGIKKNPWCFKLCCIRHKTRFGVDNKTNRWSKHSANLALEESNPAICFARGFFNRKSGKPGNTVFSLIPNQSFQNNLLEDDFKGLLTGYINRSIDRAIDTTCPAIKDLRKRADTRDIYMAGGSWYQGFGFGFVYMGDIKGLGHPEVIRVGPGLYLEQTT